MRKNVWMANFTLINSQWFGALLTDGANGPVRTPFYYVFDLYRNHFGSNLVDVEISNNPIFANKELGIVPAVDNNPTLDVIASVDLPPGSTYLAVINRDMHESRQATIQVDSVAAGVPAEVNQIANASANAVNGYALSSAVVDVSLDPVRIVGSTWTNVTGHDSYNFPPNSITIFRW
jgi:alpha-L-arabinofuranosidase